MFRLWMVILILCMGGQVRADDVLTLPQALQEARINNPALQEALARIRIAQAERMSAGRLENPELEFELSGWKDNDAGAEDDTLRSVEIRQPLGLLGARRLQKKIADNDVRIHEWNLQAVGAQIEADVKTTYAQALVSQKQAELMQENMETSRKFLKSVEERYQSGEVFRNDLERARIETSMIENELLSLEHARRKSLAQLNLLLGRSPEVNIILQDDLKEETLNRTLEELTQTAMSRRPDMRVSGLELDSAQKNISQQRRNRWPSWSVGAQRTEEDGEEDYAVLLGFHLPFWNIHSAEVRKAKAQRDLQVLHQQILKHEIAADVYLAFLDVQSAQKRLAVSKMSLEGSANLLKLAHERYAEGKINFLDYRDQIRTAVQVKSDYLQSLFEMNDALNALENVIHASVRDEEVSDGKI